MTNGAGVWVVLPTYQEAENVGPISAAILAALPGGDPARRRRRTRPTGPATWPTSWRRPTPASASGIARPSRVSGAPTSTGSASPSTAAPTIVVQMDADFSHDPERPARPASPRSSRDAADLVIGSRYAAGGGVVDWGIGRRVISRGGSLFARTSCGSRRAT